MNLYLVAAVLFSIVLTILILRDLLGDSLIDTIEKQYDQLNHEDRAKVDVWLEKMIAQAEKRKQKKLERRVKRRIMLAKIISSNKWLWITFFFIAYKFILRKDEAAEFKKEMIENYPHLRDAIENEEQIKHDD